MEWETLRLHSQEAQAVNQRYEPVALQLVDMLIHRLRLRYVGAGREEGRLWGTVFCQSNEVSKPYFSWQAGVAIC